MDKIYCIINKRKKLRYYVKSDINKKAIFTIVCMNFNWNEKECIIKRKFFLDIKIRNFIKKLFKRK